MAHFQRNWGFHLRAGKSFVTGAVTIALLVVGGPVVADNSGKASARTVQSISSVGASGQGSRDGGVMASAPAPTVQTSSVLQAAASNQAGRAANSRERSSGHRVNHQAKIQLMHKMTRLVQSSRIRLERLHADYQTLANMSEAEKLQAFPEGDHFGHLQAAAIRYNTSVEVYYMAVAQQDVAKAALTGGQALSGGVVEELNALLGQ